MTRYPMIPLALGLCAAGLSACSGGGSGSAATEPYAVARSITLDGSSGALPADPAAYARAASLLLELSDELDDYVDDLDEWVSRESGACRGGGQVSVTRADAGAGLRETRLTFDECREGDDFRDGVVTLSCAATGCAGDGRVVFGNAGQGFLDQDLDARAVSSLLLGEIEFEDYLPSRESGNLVLDLDAQFADRDGHIGTARFDALRYELAAVSRDVDSRGYDGGFRFTAFRTRAGTCTSAATTQVSTTQPLQYDDARDRTDSGALRFGNLVAGTVTWSSGSVTATAPGGSSQSYGERELDALCDV
jgi:hypothetical protein